MDELPKIVAYSSFSRETEINENTEPPDRQTNFVDMRTSDPTFYRLASECVKCDDMQMWMCHWA